MSSWMDDPEAKAWARHVLDEVVPMIEQSLMSISLVPKGETDIKFAVELGLSIMLDKPLIGIVAPGTKVPERLVRVMDEIVECDPTTPEGKERVADAIARMKHRFGQRG